MKISLLVTSEILGLFGNILIVDRMLSRHRWQKLPQQVQTLLSQKWRTFSAMLSTFFNSTQKFSHFGKKDQLHSLNILEVIDLDKCGYFNAGKLLF